MSAVGMPPTFIEEVEVRGARPTGDARVSIDAVRLKLHGCAKPDAEKGANVSLDLEVLAAGFVDRVSILARDGAANTWDEDCVTSVFRSTAFLDRGKEPSSHVVVRLSLVGDRSSVPPRPGPTAIARAIEPWSDEVSRCLTNEETGNVVVRLIIAQDGLVRRASAHDGTLRNDWARACISNVLRRMQFEGVLENEVEVGWLFSFSENSTRRTEPMDKDLSGLFEFIGCAQAFALPRAVVEEPRGHSGSDG